ncbi:uncharacterized protein LOC111079068 [Drosophila obscura]|uniref:uncharacterized protein LOC111079068 n=1 Tax=Drosophila obscura TaxID=7282 RepID=UPI001BB27130|nr:uncharacterized protein LOC111079068 [Drosophila obscura]
MKSLRKELPFRSILLLRNEKDADSCWSREDFDQDIPILNLNANQGVYLKKIFNSEMLAMVCVNRSEGDTMKALYRNLQDIRYTPTIIMTQSDTNLSALFEDCRSHKMLNVLALKDSDREFVYSYRAFPRLQVVKRRVLHIRRYIEPQVKNMEGYQINVLPDNIMPRSVVYRDAQGRRRMTGYLAHLIRNFVGTLNATMHICWDYVPEEEIIDKMTMLNLSNGGAVDFPLVCASPDEFGTNSIVLEQASWFLMLPMEANTPRARLFYRMEVYKLMPMIILLALVLSFVQRLEKGLGPSVSLRIFGGYILSQARLTRPIFRRSQEIVFHPGSIFAMPLPKNSIYWQAFNQFLLLTHDSGLYEFWFRRTFNELAALGMMSYHVDNSTQPYQDLVWEDFFFIWLLYIGGTFASLLVFIFEVLYFKWKHGVSP